MLSCKKRQFKMTPGARPMPEGMDGPPLGVCQVTLQPAARQLSPQLFLHPLRAQGVQHHQAPARVLRRAPRIPPQN